MGSDFLDTFRKVYFPWPQGKSHGGVCRTLGNPKPNEPGNILRKRDFFYRTVSATFLDEWCEVNILQGVFFLDPWHQNEGSDRDIGSWQPFRWHAFNWIQANSMPPPRDEERMLWRGSDYPCLAMQYDQITGVVPCGRGHMLNPHTSWKESVWRETGKVCDDALVGFKALGVRAEKMTDCVVKDPRQAVHRQGGNGGVVIKAPPPVHCQASNPRPLHRNRRPEGRAQIGPLLGEL
jgi:hypothetical protein